VQLKFLYQIPYDHRKEAEDAAAALAAANVLESKEQDYSYSSSYDNDAAFASFAGKFAAPLSSQYGTLLEAALPRADLKLDASSGLTVLVFCMLTDL